MKIIDISWPLSPVTTSYKDKKVIQVNTLKEFAKDGVRETSVILGSHSGTHVDAASHFLQDGTTIDQLDLHQVVGKCRVIEIPHTINGITREDLLSATGGVHDGEIILLKTANSASDCNAPFNPNFVYLERSAAQYVALQNIRAIGIDYLGIERMQPDHETHILLMQANIVVIEGLRLAVVDPGEYFLVCLPLYMLGVEAAPARAILIAGV